MLTKSQLYDESYQIEAEDLASIGVRFKPRSRFHEIIPDGTIVGILPATPENVESVKFMVKEGFWTVTNPTKDREELVLDGENYGIKQVIFRMDKIHKFDKRFDKMTESETMRKLINEATKVTLNEGSYWSGGGKYEEQARELQELVPPTGPAETLQGELFRAATRIYYDYYNNGWGNNWAAAFEYLDQHIKMDSRIKNWLADHAGGYTYGETGERNDQMIEQFMDQTIKQIMSVDPERPIDHDMLDTKYDHTKYENRYEDDDDYYY